MGRPSRLNWGCGPDMRAGWVNSDVMRYPAVHDNGVLVTQGHLGDIRDGLPYRAGQFEYAASHHALQMLAWPELVPALAELRRVLRPGGWLRLTVPDLEAALRAWTDDDVGWFPIADEHEPAIDGKLCMYLTQAGASRSVFTAAWLSDLLRRAGFDAAARLRPGMTLCPDAGIMELDSRPAESILMEAVR